MRYDASDIILWDKKEILKDTRCKYVQKFIKHVSGSPQGDHFTAEKGDYVAIMGVSLFLQIHFQYPSYAGQTKSCQFIMELIQHH